MNAHEARPEESAPTGSVGHGTRDSGFEHDPVVLRAGSTNPDAPLVVLLHGRGADETSIVGLAELLPAELSYAAVRAPIAEGAGYAWFANRGIGRPLPESLAATMGWFRTWLDRFAAAERPVALVGFSGGAAFAGGLVLQDPARFAGAAVLFGTLPFEAGVPTDDGQLAGLPVLVEQGVEDRVIPQELLDRTWQYLTGPSGARSTALRLAGGHGLSMPAVAGLRDWLLAILGPQQEESAIARAEGGLR